MRKKEGERMTQIGLNLPAELMDFVESQRLDEYEAYSLIVRRIVRELKEIKEKDVFVFKGDTAEYK